MQPFPMAALLTAPALISCPAPVEREVLAMGTRLSLRLEGLRSERASEAVVEEVARIEAACSTWRPDSPWSRLNAAEGQTVPLDPEWIRLLARAQVWARETNQTFDPVMLALIKIWGVREGGRIPSAQEQAHARAASGSALLHLDPQAGTGRLIHPRAGIEEGGFLKGYALDAARSAAEPRGAASGLLDFGGQLLAWGRASEVDVAHPRRRNEPLLRLLLTNASLATSGCSERGRHILDPRTGFPSPDWGSVTVVAPSAFDADVLSTALFVMGPAQGFEWATSRRWAAAFLSHDGRVLLTPAFQSLNPTLLESR